LPNALTWLRILMIPAVIVIFYLPYGWKDPVTCGAFALAGITDSLDGYLARRWGQTSRLGAFLDPVADKLIVTAALVLIVSRDPRWFMVIVAVVIIGREIAVSALREWMAEIGARGRIKVSVWGKYKTIMQIVGLSFLLLQAEPVRSAHLQDGSGAHRHRRGAHALVHVSVPEARVAGAARQRSALRGRPGRDACDFVPPLKHLAALLARPAA
jgi:CDP-diacylglycerol--glycerol-3-phosphate 3-phosphatidyltransferase